MTEAKKETLLTRIPVVVDYNQSTPNLSGWLSIAERGDTIVFRQHLDHPYDSAQHCVFIPRGLLEALFEKPVCEHLSWESNDPRGTHCFDCKAPISALTVAMNNSGVGNPLYPYGKCDVCGFGTNIDNFCTNIECPEATEWKPKDTYSDIFNGEQ